MKHYVMGFVFNESKTEVLLIEKKRPKWQAGHWNGIGGKIEQNEKPADAMQREMFEETGGQYRSVHCLTFICPGGTVYVFKAVAAGNILFRQEEDEQLKVWQLDELPFNMMANLKWIIPVCLSTIQFPLLVQQNTLGVD